MKDLLRNLGLGGSTGHLGRDRDRILLTQRERELVLGMLFEDEVWQKNPWWKPFSQKKPISYFYTPAGTQFSSPSTPSVDIEQSDPVHGTQEFFDRPGTTILEVGSGNGDFAQYIAARNPQGHVIALDRAYGAEREMPRSDRPNIRFVSGDWRVFEGIEDGSVDAVLGNESFARYQSPTRESVAALNRISRVGTILRATYTSKVHIGKPTFVDLLAETGWDVWRANVSTRPGNRLRLLIAEKKIA